MNFPACDECRAIVAEFREAFRLVAEEMRASRLSTDSDLAQSFGQALTMQTGADVALAEEVFPAIHLKSSPRIRLVIERNIAHRMRTGHKLDASRPFSMSGPPND